MHVDLSAQEVAHIARPSVGMSSPGNEGTTYPIPRHKYERVRIPMRSDSEPSSFVVSVVTSMLKEGSDRHKSCSLGAMATAQQGVLL